MSLSKKKSNHIQSAMRHHSIIFLIVGVLVVFGYSSLPKLNKDEFPQFTIRQGIVAAVYPGASAQEIEEQVTKPLENFLFTYPEVDKEKTYSVTENGIVYVYVELRLSVKEKDVAWSKIRHGLQLFKKTSLPAGVLETVVVDDFGNTSSMLLAIEAQDRTPRELEKYAEKLCDNLRTIPSMGNLKISGKQNEEIALIIDQDKLAAYGISQRALLIELSTQGFRTVSGSLDDGEEKSMVHLSIPYQSEYELGEQIIYADPSGQVVHLRDIARIERRYAAPKNFIQYNGVPTVLVSMEMTPGNNIVAFGQEVNKMIEKTGTQIPPDIHIHKITNQPKVVQDSVKSFLRDLFISIIVVIAVMLTLFPLRTAIVSGTSLPVCTGVTLGLMYLFGIELNTVTLAALIVVLGLIVDDSIIVIDGYVDLLHSGHSRWYSAVNSTRQLFVPMTLATLAISGMFFPLTRIITGPVGDFVQLFPWTIAFALVCSIFYAIYVIPYLSARFIKNNRPEDLNRVERMQNRFFAWLQNFYNKTLVKCFRHPGRVIGITVGAVAVGVLLLARLNIVMFPKADRNCFVVEIHLAEGSNLSQTKAIADSLEHILRKDDKVVSITSFIGTSSPRFHATYAPQMAHDNYAQFIVNTVSEKATLKMLKEYGPKYENYFPEAYLRFKQIDYQAVNNPIEVRFSGDDFAALKSCADTLKDYMNTLPAVTWVHSDADETCHNIKVELKNDEATRLGVTQGSLSIYLSSVLGGQQMTAIWEDDYKIPVTVYSLEAKDSSQYERLKNLQIPTSIPGVWVPLRQIADVGPEWQDAVICHRNSIPTVTVGADLRYGCSHPETMKKIEKYINQEMKPALPDGIEISYGGMSSANKTIMPEIILSVLAALLVLFVFLLYHFTNIRLVLLTISASAIALFGACLGLTIFGLDFSITATLGLVSLIGIIVRNGIIMYEYAESLRLEHHLTAKEAGFEAGQRRMRPIFLTAAAAALGVVPMIIAHTSLWMPMGVVICFGTIFSFPFVVTLLPVAYWQILKGSDKKHHNGQSIVKQ